MRPFPASLVFGLATAFSALLLLLCLHPSYGYFLDELYYLACARRLDFGYVDHPPLAPALLALNRVILGDSQLALRIPPALCGGATIVLAGWLVWKLGGGRFAQVLAALCIMTAPGLFGLFSFYSMNCFEIVLWTLTICLLFEMGRTGDGRLWLMVGLLLGLAVQNKHTSLVFVGALAFAVVVSPARRHLLERPLWLGAALFALIALPNLYWQIEHGFASLEFYANVDREANVSASALSVLEGQVAGFNPATLPVWAAGLYLFLIARRGQRDRLVGWVLVALFAALLIAGKSRPDRIAGAYPALFAAGAVHLEAVFARRGFRWLRTALPAALVAIGVIVAPVTVPILAPDLVARYMKAIGADDVVLQRELGTSVLLLPLAHRRGSEELVEAVSRVYAELDPAKREQAVILASGYAPAGAIEVLGGAELPPVYSPHNNYHLWGPPAFDPELVVAVGFEPEQLAPYFENVDVVARVPCRYCMGWRQNVPISLATVPRISIRDAWPDLRHYGYSLRKVYLLEQAGLL